MISYLQQVIALLVAAQKQKIDKVRDSKEKSNNQKSKKSLDGFSF